MTYLQFHLVFLAPALLCLAYRRRRRRGSQQVVAPWSAIALVAGIALLYTLPWDAALIGAGVWRYAPGRVVATLGPVPVEELLFIVLQTALIGLWTGQLRQRHTHDAPVSIPAGLRARTSGTAGWLSAGLTGLGLMLIPGGLYLGSLLAWASIPLALHAAIGGDVLAATRRLRLLATTVPVLFLSLADRSALALGIWQISPRQTLGLSIGGLPLEEAVFFVLSTELVVNTVLLLQTPQVLDRLPTLHRRSRRRVPPSSVLLQQSNTSEVNRLEVLRGS